ncbi:MAG: hypothetical protein JWM88_1537 [Verrucomicrobia bacterium]|jgi:predicted outer membrane protein|nr:hypothetical protein [Lacunisphaera sp.]MDB6168673.1 hypothetical protein [Verrucomicrobiota bacterium]
MKISFPPQLFRLPALVAGLAALSATAQLAPSPSNPNPGNPSSPGPAYPANPINPINPTPTEPVLPPPSDEIKVAGAPANANRHTENLISKLSMLTSEETRLSQVATQRAAHSQVRTLAEQVMGSSQAIEQEIGRLAQTRNVTTPTGKDANDLADAEQKLQKKEGKSLDEDYVKRTVKIHQDAIDELEGYCRNNDADAEVVAFAQKHLPALRENLRQAESVRAQAD